VYDLLTVAQTDIDNISSVEYPAAGLTLTRSATLAITTAATAITWQTETRNYGYTWSTINITIPTDGYYLVAFNCALVLNTTLSMRLVVNGQQRQNVYNAVAVSTGGGFSFSAVFSLYFNTSDFFSIQLVPGANTTVNVNAENTPGASPFLHVVQLTGSVE